MALSIRGYAAQSATTPLGPHTFERREPRPDDVVIDILYCGVCHSDLHQARNEWNSSTFPIVPGHEIVGRVSAVGADVGKFKVGDMVGVGCVVDSCRHCSSCQRDMEQYCLEGATWTYNGTDRRDGQPTFGGYSERIVVTEHFVVRIDDRLDPKSAAPLLCAGITTFSPLRHWGAGPGKKVAVVGLGGLGHMAVKLAHAMGAEVTVLSRSLSKRDDGLRLGADHYYATEDPQTFEELKNSFDLIVNTVSAPIDLGAYLGLLRRNGTMVNVGAPAEPLPVMVFTLFRNRRSFAGSSIGGIRETQEMLDFCAQHGILPDTELIEASYINEAWKRVLSSDVRYRFVIDAATFA